MSVIPALKTVRLKPQNLTSAQEIETKLKLSSVSSRILAARGFTPGEDLEKFINPSLKDGIPHPKDLKGLTEAVTLIKETIKNNEAIAITCDFDVDGLTGGAQVFDFLKRIHSKVFIFVPDRFSEGYGLNDRIINDAKTHEAKLLITIDFGTTNTKEFILAREHGIKSIVIDHHHVSENPPADVFINPKQNGCGFADASLCASGLCWFLLVGLRQEIKEASNIDVREFLDLAAMGTICDMVELKGPNRTLAKRGLERISDTKRIGLKNLKALAGVRNPVGCYDVSFGLGPRINAAGRIVHGEMVIELLTTTDQSQAAKIAQKLNSLNAERQEIELSMKEIAVKNIEAKKELPFGMVVASKTFHTGVIGIVAQRLVEVFYRPSCVLGEDAKGIYKGSVRGIKGFSVIGALQETKDLLLKFGGHDGAGGFSIEEKNLTNFESLWNQVCEKSLKKLEVKPYAEADTEAELSEIKKETIEELESLAPFGVGNPSPQVLLKKLRVVDAQSLKGAHLKLQVSDGRVTMPALMWKTPSHPHAFPGAFIDVVAKPDLNLFNGLATLQLTLQAIEKSV